MKSHVAKSLYRSNFKTFNQIGFRLVERVFSDSQQLGNLSVVLVSHSMFTGLPAIEAAARIAGKKNLYLVLKNSSENRSFSTFLESCGYNILDLKKDDFKKKPDRVIESFSQITDNGERKLLLLDHGGYGAYHIEAYSSSLNFSGIVEYALNGRKRYEANGITETRIPFASMAEATIKLDPDYACGRLIGQMTASETQQHNGFGIHLRGLVQAGIVGYGKLGSKAAETLVRSGAHNVMVYDNDPKKMIRASGEGFNVSSYDVRNIAANCNVIIVGADTAPIRPEMYELMPQDTIISTVTSPDDTLDIDGLKESKTLVKKRVEGRIHTYEVGGKGSGKFVHLIADGNAPNLKDSPFGVNDPTLFMPLTLHPLVGYELAQNGEVNQKRMLEMEDLVRERYLDVYQWILANPQELRTSRPHR